MKHVFPLAALMLTTACLAAETAPAPRKFTAVSLPSPRAVAVDTTGNLYVGDVDAGSVFKLTPDGVVTALGAGGTAIKDPIGIAVHGADAVVVADADDNAVFLIFANGNIAALGKPAPGESGLATPTSVAVDAKGSVFVTDNAGASIRKIAADGTLSTFAGKKGVTGGADGTGAAASFATPRGIAIDGDGNLYVADEGNSNIRKITPAGVVSTLAGAAGQAGSADGTGAAARFAAPRGLAADAKGTVYVADTDNHTIRKITPAGVVTTIAGKPGESGAADGKGAAARFNEPRSVAVDAAGNVYVADTGNAAIRQITPAGVVTTVAAATVP